MLLSPRWSNIALIRYSLTSPVVALGSATKVGNWYLQTQPLTSVKETEVADQAGEVSHKHQPVRDLVEFTFFARPIEGEENTFDLMVELRIEHAEVDQCDVSEAFTVRLKRVFISLDYSGAEIVPGSKLGEPISADKFDLKRNVEREYSAEAKTSADADAAVNTGGIGSGQVKLAVSGKAARSLNVKESSVSETSVMRVRAVGNDRWEIAEFDGSPVKGKIINNQPLCRLSKSVGSNAVLVGGSILAKQKDFHFDYEGSLFSRMSVNDKKLLGVFLTKKLQAESFQGEVSLAEFEITM